MRRLQVHITFLSHVFQKFGRAQRLPRGPIQRDPMEGVASAIAQFKALRGKFLDMAPLEQTRGKDKKAPYI